MPGSRVPIVTTEVLASADAPDYLVILPWNWADDMKRRARELGYRGQFCTMVPTVKAA